MKVLKFLLLIVAFLGLCSGSCNSVLKDLEEGLEGLEEPYHKTNSKLNGVFKINGKTFYWERFDDEKYEEFNYYTTFHSKLDISHICPKKINNSLYYMSYEGPCVGLDIEIDPITDIAACVGKKMKIVSGEADYYYPFDGEEQTYTYTYKRWDSVKSGYIIIKDVNTNNKTITMQLKDVVFDNMRLLYDFIYYQGAGSETLTVEGTLTCTYDNAF